MYRIVQEVECKNCLHRFTYNRKHDDLTDIIVNCPECKTVSVMIIDAESKRVYRNLNIKILKRKEK